MPSDMTRSLENLKLERDAIVLYDALASIEKDPRRASAFHQIAANERRHADIWARKLEAQGAAVPAPDPRPRLRVATIILLARVFGTRAVSDLVTALEGDEGAAYEGQSSPEVAAIAADEREHAEIWRRLQAKPGNTRAALASADAPATAASAVGPAPAAEAAPGPSGADAGVVEEIAARERWHRSGRSGTLRAVIFGVSDGLVSNLALVMGVAGAAGDEGRFILLAGIAGLLAGAFSMAAGEYISMQSQRELFERQIALERAEIEEMPEEEEAELAALYRAKGFPADESARIAARIFRNPEQALDTLVREELGLDPDELGSPIGAAGGSFVAFGIGALVPVAPYIVTGGSAAFVASLSLSIVALFGVGAGVSLLTGRSVLFSGTRQVLIGAAAAAVTYVVGSVIGVAVA